MRRSLQDSIVGFSLLGGILIFTFFSFWLRGVRLSSKNWYLFAEFNNASGLSKKSPVTYRGILVGSIEDILFTNESIKAKIVLNNPVGICKFCMHERCPQLKKVFNSKTLLCHQIS